MKRLRFLPSADADLKDIHLWVAQDDEGAADRLVRRIVAATGRLGAFPESAPSREELGEGIRSLVVGRYLVLYRVGPDSVDVIRIVHSARDLERLGEDGVD